MMLRLFGTRLLYRIRGWSLIFQAASGERHLKSWKEHETWVHLVFLRRVICYEMLCYSFVQCHDDCNRGPIVRIGPNQLSINTIAALKQFMAILTPTFKNLIGTAPSSLLQ
ncbi:hypothetical protein VTO42DRAFT_1767 [Malbranchea cinnamomea]